MNIKNKKLIVANWKMNPETPREAQELLSRTKAVARRARRAQVVVCPPAVFLSRLRAGENLQLGSQDVFFEPVSSGPHTGAVSAVQLKHTGAEWALLGHSESRARGETDELINRKIKAALKAGLRIIVCVGERARDAAGDYLQAVRQNLEAATADLRRADFTRLVVAYEPLWAIGDQAVGADTPAGFLEQAIFIRRVMSAYLSPRQASELSVLYGGSVDEKNAAAFLSVADGLLVGRASLRADKFSLIVRAADELPNNA